MLKKKMLALASAGALTVALSAAAFAGGQTPEPMAAPDYSGFTAGLSYGPLATNLPDFAAMLGYVNNWFLADVGLGYKYIGVSGTSTNASVFALRADLGLRHYLEQSLFFTYGVLGSYGWVNNSGTTVNNPYAVGPFVGLDYQPMSHLLLSGKISPVTYVRALNNSTSTVNTTGWDVFSVGTLAVSYVFN